jgi:pyridoxine/pyridoxamine 5'-phosphate oxidase
MEIEMYSAKDYDQALLTPESVFADPMKVVETDSMTPEQKLAVLKRWEANATDLETAATESMTAATTTDGSSRLRDVGKAILALTDRENVDQNNVVQVASTQA